MKAQNEQFSQIHYLIELNKFAIERMDKKVDTLPIYKDLEETDEFIYKYLPYKIQNMIDDTLFSCIGKTSLQRLVQYEDIAFKNLDTNRKTKQGKLPKKDFEIPNKKLRQLIMVRRQSSRMLSESGTNRH